MFLLKNYFMISVFEFFRDWLGRIFKPTFKWKKNNILARKLGKIRPRGRRPSKRRRLRNSSTLCWARRRRARAMKVVRMARRDLIERRRKLMRLMKLRLKPRHLRKEEGWHSMESKTEFN